MDGEHNPSTFPADRMKAGGVFPPPPARCRPAA